MSMGLCARSLTMVLYNGASCISEHLSDVAGPPYLSPNKLIELRIQHNVAYTLTQWKG